MTPAARYAAAMEVVDRIAEGRATEAALTTWARSNRFAGSKDRAAVRDIVFDIVRRWRSTAHDGGGQSGRARVRGLLRQRSEDPEAVFTGEGYAAPALSAEERAVPGPADRATALDLPDSLVAEAERSTGARFGAVFEALRNRADVHLRVNTLRTDLAAARARLATEGIDTEPHPLCATALRVLTNPRRVAQSGPYRDGWVELQDAASQAVVAFADPPQTGRILDFCAGGGGKALALAAAVPSAEITAHDIAPARMADIPARAARAGARITQVEPGKVHGPFDLVFADAPCSGSGAWRRSPDGKWQASPERLRDLNGMQDDVLSAAAPL
ncbi:MAG: RsmB/NOP family class I SAM-dependent RNA methyltransferase, partial [Pseudomonadota bacterium]